MYRRNGSHESTRPLFITVFQFCFLVPYARPSPMSADDALHEPSFHNRRPGWFRTSSSKCLSEQPQGRCFLVEMTTNHRLQNRSGLAVAVVNVTDERKPNHPQEQAAIGQPAIMLWRTYIKTAKFSFAALRPGSRSGCLQMFRFEMCLFICSSWFMSEGLGGQI